MVEREFSKLHTRVRFPSPAPASKSNRAKPAKYNLDTLEQSHVKKIPNKLVRLTVITHVSNHAVKIGAGEGNRTLVSGLGRPRSTIEPHPPPRFGAASPTESFYQTIARMAIGLMFRHRASRFDDGFAQSHLNQFLPRGRNDFAAVEVRARKNCQLPRRVRSRCARPQCPLQVRRTSAKSRKANQAGPRSRSR